MLRNIIVKVGGLSAIAFAAMMTLSLGYFTAEPALAVAGTATSTSQFTISQQITSQIAFATTAANITMQPIGGITGGTSNGATQVVVTTNSLTGYTMTIQASSSLGMIGNASSTNVIPAYVPASPLVPDYAFNAPANTARFGYSVAASTTSDVDQKFLNNGSACNTGATGNSGTGSTFNCWLNASTTPIQIVNRTSPTPAGGATTTIGFRVVVMSNPNPVLPSDTYVATTTLTATAI